MGPRATWAFCEALTDNIQFELDQDHPRIIVDCNAQIPGRTSCLLHGGKSPAPPMAKSISRLMDMGADLIAVPCNQAHFWRDMIVGDFDIPWIDMIAVVLEEVGQRGFNNPVIVGGYVTAEKLLYGPSYTYFKSDKIHKMIINVKAGNRKGLINSLMPELLEIGDSVVIACTELSVSKKWEHLAINSLQVYAREIARLAMHD